jgi:phosphomannomutase/phosphoglucomutase
MRPPPDATPREYVCPGEGYAISRAVHLARMAAAYPKCRECPLCEDEALRPDAVGPSADPFRRLFATEGVRGVYQNEVDRPTAERLAEALAAVVWEDALAAGGRPPARGFPVVVGYDDRPWSLPLAVAAGASLRRSGCEAIDIGLATGPAFRFAVAHLEAAAGLLATGSGGGPAVAGIDFALAGGRPLSSGAGLDRVAEQAARGVGRLTRTAGGRREFGIAPAYEAGLKRHFRPHPPLVAVVGTASSLLPARLERVFAGQPVKLHRLALPRRPLDAGGPDSTTFARLAEAVRETRSDFGLWIDESGDAGRLIDETGRAVSVAALAGLLLSDALNERPGSTVALDWSLAEQLVPRVLPGDVLRGNGTAEAMFLSMADHAPAAGADSAGRFWLPGRPPVCDAVAVVARLVRLFGEFGGPVSRLASRPAALDAAPSRPVQ